jgi:hypothetical protein
LVELGRLDGIVHALVVARGDGLQKVQKGLELGAVAASEPVEPGCVARDGCLDLEPLLNDALHLRFDEPDLADHDQELLAHVLGIEGVLHLLLDSRRVDGGFARVLLPLQFLGEVSFELLHLGRVLIALLSEGPEGHDVGKRVPEFRQPRVRRPTLLPTTQRSLKGHSRQRSLCEV